MLASFHCSAWVESLKVLEILHCRHPGLMVHISQGPEEVNIPMWVRKGDDRLRTFGLVRI